MATMVARWLQPDFYIECVWPYGLDGLWLRYATLQNLIPSFPWIAPPRPPPWRNPKKGRDQILPSGNIGDNPNLETGLVAVPLEVHVRLARRVGSVVAELVGVGAVVVRLEVGALWDGRLDALNPLACVQLNSRRILLPQ